MLVGWGGNNGSTLTDGVIANDHFTPPHLISSLNMTTPDINSFGHTFRNYDEENKRQKGVEEFYRLQHINHNDYMYLVAKENNTTLPSAALFIIRYHSFYALHREGAYKHLMNDEDAENLKWLQIFSNYDLYSKSKIRVDVEEVKPYYLSLIEKYFPLKLRW